MQLLNKIIVLVFVLSMGACTKKTLQQEAFYYGKVELMVANLPNTPLMEVRYDNKVDTLESVGTPWSVTGQTAERKRISVYKAGTNLLIADTAIALIKDSTLSLKVGYSTDFQISGFIGASSAINPDSCKIMLYNNLPVEIQPDGVEVDAYLYMWDATGALVPTGNTWEHFTRNKLHPKTVTVNLKDAGQYVFKFKDRATGEFLKDKRNGEVAAPSLSGGKYLLVSISGKLLIGKMTFKVDQVEL